VKFCFVFFLILIRINFKRFLRVEFKISKKNNCCRDGVLSIGAGRLFGIENILKMIFLIF
jgi:hypothetical protein